MTKRGRDDAAATVTNADILATVHMLRTLPGTAAARQAEGRRRVPDFADRFPHLFKMACSDVFEIERLTQFLAMREQVRRGNMTHEEASRSVGQQYFNEFVAPTVGRSNNPTTVVTEEEKDDEPPSV